MKCCICESEIEKKFLGDEMYWDKGNNPAPVKNGENDRCCDFCNDTVVIPTRMGLPPNTLIEGMPDSKKN